MLICPRCNKEQKDGAKFCASCGTKLFPTLFCPNCGEKVNAEFAFCEKCGAPIHEHAAVKTEAKKKHFKRKGAGKTSPKWLTFIKGAAAIVVVLVIIFAGRKLLGGGNQNFCVYLKNGELVYDDFSEDGAFELTQRLGTADVFTLYGIRFSENGKYVFYPDKMDDSESGATIYRRNVKQPDKEPVRIDSEVMHYEIDSAGKRLIYLKGDEGELYSYDLKDREKIASDVESIVYVAEDLSVIYYMKDEGLYRQEKGEETATKILSGNVDVMKIYDTGEIYYTKEKVEEINLADYVIDDMADADAAITVPESPVYPFGWEYDTDEAYNAAVEKYNIAYEKYEAAYDNYLKKMERDNIRSAIQGYTMEKSRDTLYYYDGKESELISDVYNLKCAADRTVIGYSKYGTVSTKVKLSEVTDLEEVEEMVRDELYSSEGQYVAVGKQTYTLLEESRTCSECFTADGKMLYFVADVVSDELDEEYGNLYKATVTDKGVQKPELVDSNVYAYGVCAIEKSVVYYKNSENELWTDGRKISEDVKYISIYDDDPAVYYCTDWDEENDSGTLKMYRDGEITKIREDVYSWIRKEDGILYLQDYDEDSGRGALYLYKNGKSEKISDDVNYIIY